MRLMEAICLVALMSQPGLGQDLPLFKNVASELGFTIPDLNAWGQAWEDYDGDGDLDVFVARFRTPKHSYVYRNDGTIFSDVSDQFGLTTDPDHTWQAIWVDFDNDGDKDLYYSAQTKIHLLRNDGGTFVEVGTQVGLVTPPLPIGGEYYSSAWADYDLDGDLDVLITALPHRQPSLFLFRNDGSSFVDVRDQVGLPGSGYEHMFVITWIDYDRDGDPDLWTAGDDRGRLFRNDNGTFIEISQQIGLSAGPTITSYWFDYDNDLDVDLYTVGYQTRGQANQLFRNDGGQFVDVASSAGVDLLGYYRSLSVGDFDNDADQDMYIDINPAGLPAVFFLNEQAPDGSRFFGDVAQPAGLTEMTESYGSATTDYNADGWLDIFVVGDGDRQVFYKNTSTLQNNWVGFKLIGTRSNRDAIGAWVRIVAGGKSQIRTKFAGDGRNVQQLPWIHFGIGTGTTVDSVIVDWPLGRREIWTNVAINQYHTLVEGTGTVGVRERDGVPKEFRLEQNYPNPFNAQTRIRYTVPRAGVARIVISNLLGEVVRAFVVSHSIGGHFDISWDGRDAQGQSVPSGVYFYCLEGADFVAVRKMLLLR